MDATGKLKNDKGSVLVFIAVGMVVLLALTALAIDLGYMYVAKGQLQSAADAAALAGAGRLDGTNSFAQYSARNAAVRFAGKNNAAGESVAISSDYSNSQSSSNDITIGTWNGTTFTPGTMPVNAIEVRTRRTSESSGGPISLFFGKAFGFHEMGAAASAVASRPMRGGTYIMLNYNVCMNATAISPSSPYTLTPSVPFQNMAWTSLTSDPTSASSVQETLFCPSGNLPNIPVCGRNIHTNNGTISQIFKSVEIDFYDPNYDRGRKTFRANGTVDKWTVIVPVGIEGDDVGVNVPHPVWGYAEIVMSRACGSGGGNACPGRDFNAPSGVCSGGENDLVIESIVCTSCADSVNELGAKPSLVR